VKESASMKKLLIFTLVFLILASFVCSSDEGLEIDSVTIYHNGEKEGTIQNGARFSEVVEPGDKLELEIELENTFSDNIDIEDIEILLKIENIKEGENITEDISKFDLNDDSSKIKSIRVDIPNDADEIVKTVELDVRGVDENGTVHKINWVFDININDDKHDITVYTTKLKPETVECNGTAELTVWIENNGEYDEEDVVLIVENEKLGIYKKYTNLEVDEGEKYAKSVFLEFNDVVESDYYFLNLKTYYKDDHLDDLEEVGLTVHKCKESLVEIEIDDSNDSDEDLTDEIPLSEVEDYETQKTSKNKSGSVLVGLLIGLLVLIIIILIIVFALSRL
jgi:hypothetical protein